MKEEKESVVKENIATPTLPTTPYYMKSWGYYNKNKKIYIEQINKEYYLCNIKEKKGIARVTDIKGLVEGKEKKIGEGFTLGDMQFIVSGTISSAYGFYNTPSFYSCEKYVQGKIKPRPFKEIYADLREALKVMFDFSSDLDIEVSGIQICQSWLKPLLNNAFFYGIDATKGGGKTTLGEIVYFLMRHGFVGGNISSAALVRLADELDLNVFVDEIDQNMKDDDIMAALRKGQRRGNPYVRCEGRNNTPKAYNLFGCHGYSYRSDVEDAFMDRSLRVHTTKSKDHMLPVINSFKQEALKHLADELFFWLMDNIHVVSCSRESRCSRVFGTQNFSRNALFQGITKEFNEKEQEFMKEVFGRDNELAFLCLQCGKMLDIDFLGSLREIIKNKKKDLETSASFYEEQFKECFHKNKGTIFSKKLSEGDNAGRYIFPKSKLYALFIQHLKELNVATIGTKRHSSMLRDLGFVEGINLRSQRYESYPTPCLIFDEKVLESLDLTELDEIRGEFSK